MRAHLLKTIDPYYEDVELGRKPFELRVDDRIYRLGDVLVLARWRDGRFTGERIYRVVTYLLQGGAFGLEPGHVVMALKKLRASRHAAADRAVAGQQHGD